MENLERLNQLRIKLRKELPVKNKEISPWGLNISCNNENFEEVKNIVFSYFEPLSFSFENKEAPSPSGYYEDFTIYLSCIVSSENWKEIVALSVSIHHEDEKNIARDERLNYCY